MKKALLLPPMLFLLLTGCGTNPDHTIPEQSTLNNSGSAQTDNSIAQDAPISDSFIGDFENATINYDKYNSYASENGLGNTLVFIERTVMAETCIADTDFPILVLIVEQNDKNRWCVQVSSETELPIIENKYVRVFGTYVGFSDLFNLPGISVTAQEAEHLTEAKIELETNGVYEEVWNFYNDFAEKQLAQAQDETDKTTNFEPQETDQISPQDIVDTPQPTTGQRNALNTAKKYLDLMSFSYAGLIKQLEYEQYSHEDATYAADNCGADWNEQASLHAKSYLDLSSFSRDSLIEQLEFDGFTHEQAVYGVEQNGY